MFTFVINLLSHTPWWVLMSNVYFWSSFVFTQNCSRKTSLIFLNTNGKTEAKC